MRTTTILLAFAALAIMCGTTFAQYDGAVSMINLSVSPNPVMAGGNATISFQLYNAYESWLYGTSLQASGTYPILNVSPLNSIVVGQLNPGVNPRYYNYTIHISNTTPSGTYTVTFTANYFVYAATGIVTATSSMPVTFFVNNRPTIKVTASTPAGSALYAGHNQTVDLTIQNTGYGTARNVSVSVSGESGINLLSSVNTFFISNLTQGSSVTEPILVAAQNTSQAHLSTAVTYYSSTMKQHFSNSQTVNLSVAPSAQFEIGSANSSATVGSTDVPIHFKVTNNGTIAATQLQLNLETTYPITPVASSAYISSLAPGASTNVTFLITVDTAGVPGNYPVTIFEQWKQPSGAVNQQFSGSSNYFIQVVSAGSGISTTEIAAIAIIVVIVAIIAYRRTKAKKSDKSTDKKHTK